MKPKRIIVSLFAVISLLPVFAQMKMGITDLRCELLNNPLGIDTKSPRLGWQINSVSLYNVKQLAYHIIVSSTKEKLDKDEGDLWNSGKVNSDQSQFVPYAGKPLTSGIQCYWKVKSFTNKGETLWSDPALWSMGLLDKSAWKAKWIGYDKASSWDSVTQWSRLSARYLRKQFQSPAAVKRATVYICGLGLYELYINGKRIGDYVLTPAPTDYRKSALYNTYDVTGNIQSGNNVIATVLGNGRFFTMRQNYKPQKWNTFGFPKLLLQLVIEYADGSQKTVVSDDTWKLNVDGPIRTNNEYDGEEYDATKELTGWMMPGYADAKWLKPQLVAAPSGKLVPQMINSMRIMDTIKPSGINKISDDRYILDMGQNFSGWIKMKVQGKRGDKVKLRFAESLQPNGELYVANLRDAKVTDIYTLKGTGIEQWQPSFVYHGFRYVELTGYPGTPTTKDFIGCFVYDEMKSTGTFSGNLVLDRLHEVAFNGIASNYKGMPIDCPQRNERQPWLGDRATGSGGEAFLFDNAALYAKWLDDIEQSQTAEGAIPDVAPAFWNYYTDNMTWPGTYLLVADMLYRHFGDVQPIIKHYPSMKKWMDYMQKKYMKDYILTKDKYGDWCVPPESLEIIRSRDSTRTTDGQLISTAYFYSFLQYMQRFAALAGKPSDIPAYKDLAEKVKTAFNDKFYNKQRKLYDNNTVTANLLPLYFEITPESDRDAVFNNIYNKIKLTDKMHISTGVIGTQWLMRGLTRYQRSDIAYILATNLTYPSWGYMLANNATTVWELWNGNTASPQMNSQNHVMLLGDVLIWMYENIAGIKSDDTAPGFKKIIMKPEMIDGMHGALGTYRSYYGPIGSVWSTNQAGQFTWVFVIPSNTSARIYLPTQSQEEVIIDGLDKMPAEDRPRFIGIEGDRAVYEAGSGQWTFHVEYRYRKGIDSDKFIFERASFPESHAPTIAETPKGLVAAWFGGTKEGNKDVCIWVSHQSGVGEWTPPVKVADGVLNDSTRYACYNPVLFQVPGGDLLLFYKIGPNVAGWTGWMMRSSDNGLTWSKREALPPGFLGPIKNKPVLINGTLICPSSTERNGWKVHFEMTKDWGKTWTKTDSINDGKIFSAIQPSILQYPDGKLQILCRSRNRTINESWSTDGGKTWSPMTASALPNNNSGTDAVTLIDGRQLLVYNHVKPDPSLPNGKGARTPLNVAVSKDGKNWDAAVILEDSPVSQYSYPSVIQTKDGKVHIVYTWRRERIKHVVLSPWDLKLTPIVNEQWPGAKATVQKPSDD